ncbi:hypothetical protein KCP71_09085 [Salmonella enterica subsp. enterica]|nr:hypothetical protein KCP71_09085 [Salmonella enterica subsp. enterica]
MPTGTEEPFCSTGNGQDATTQASWYWLKQNSSPCWTHGDAHTVVTRPCCS